MRTNKFCVLCLHEMLCLFKVTEMSKSSFDSKDLDRSTPNNVKSLETRSTSNYCLCLVHKLACAMFVVWRFLNISGGHALNRI